MALGISIGIGVSAIAAAAGAAAASFALRGASTLNIVKPQGYQDGNARTEHIVRMPFIIGSCDFDDLMVSAYNWVFDTYGIRMQTTSPAKVGTDFEIVECAIDIGGQWKKVTWGGADSITIQSGDTDIKSDPVRASDFPALGSAFFSRGLEGGIRYKIRADATKRFPNSHAYMFGNNRRRYTIGQATVTNGVYGAGDFVISGTYDASFEPWTPVLVGTPRSNAIHLAGIGDSVLAYVGDTAYANGPAFTRAAYSNYATKANPLACINFGCPGGTIANWLGDGTNTPNNMSANATNIAKAEVYLGYANVVFEQYGTNGTYSTGGGTYLHYLKLWTVIKRGSADCELVRSSLFARTNDDPGGSADQWATVASQIPTQAPGGDTDSFERWCMSQVGGGQVDYYLNYNSCRANPDRTHVDYYKWPVNGTPLYPTTDGLHPSTAIHALMYGGEARALIDTIPVPA